MKTANVVKKYSRLVSADELASLEVAIVESLPRFFESTMPRGQHIVTVDDLNWSVASVEGDADDLLQTKYGVTAFGFRDFFVIDEVGDEDADGVPIVVLSAGLV